MKGRVVGRTICRADKLSADKLLADKLSADKLVLGKLSADKLSVGELLLYLVFNFR
jgi:hypothetical protein